MVVGTLLFGVARAHVAALVVACGLEDGVEVGAGAVGEPEALALLVALVGVVEGDALAVFVERVAGPVPVAAVVVEDDLVDAVGVLERDDVRPGRVDGADGGLALSGSLGAAGVLEEGPEEVESMRHADHPVSGHQMAPQF